MVTKSLQEILYFFEVVDTHFSAVLDIDSYFVYPKTKSPMREFFLVLLNHLYNSYPEKALELYQAIPKDHKYFKDINKILYDAYTAYQCNAENSTVNDDKKIIEWRFEFSLNAGLQVESDMLFNALCGIKGAPLFRNIGCDEASIGMLNKNTQKLQQENPKLLKLKPLTQTELLISLSKVFNKKIPVLDEKEQLIWENNNSMVREIAVDIANKNASEKTVKTTINSKIEITRIHWFN